MGSHLHLTRFLNLCTFRSTNQQVPSTIKLLFSLSKDITFVNDPSVKIDPSPCDRDASVYLDDLEVVE